MEQQKKKHMTWIFIFFIIIFAHLRLDAQDSWQKIPLMLNGQLVPTLECICVKGVVGNSDEKVDAFVLLFGKKNSGNYSLGVVIDQIDKFVSNVEIDTFRPPDISSIVACANVMEICIDDYHKKKSFGLPMNMYSSIMLPEPIRRGNNEIFKSSARMVQKKEWQNYLDSLTNGFNNGYITIGKGFFKRAIRVEFGGKDIGPPLKELITFVGR
jgi:hypothetical protein